jgi:ABC-type polysaccharide/polyol phosphate export permease
MEKIETETITEPGKYPRTKLRNKPVLWGKNINIIRELAIADFRLKYHDSVLGYLWSMLNPLLMFAIYYFVFTRIFQSSIPYYPVFLLAGIISYAFFQDCTFSGMVALATKAGMMKKIYFPKVILIVAASSTSILSYLINLCVLYLITFIFKGFTPLVLLTPLPILCLILFSMGVSFILATMYAYFRDMGQIWNVLTLMIFWVSPVVFNVENLPPSISTIVYFNPLTRIFVLLRHYLLYNYFDMRFLIMTILYSILTFIAGYFVFKKYQDNLPELF